MISEEEKEKYIEASKCDNCLCWHKYCNAECCKIIFIDVDPKDLNRGARFFTIKLDKPLSLDDRWYYRLRDVECIRGMLRFKKERIQIVGNIVMYIHPCKLLNGNLCSGHPDKKPELCKLLNVETAKIIKDKFRLTDNCLFKYKCKEVKLNEKRKN